MIQKDIFGRRICDKKCPAYHKDFCDAKMDMVGRVIHHGKHEAKYEELCQIPVKYKLVLIK